MEISLDAKSRQCFFYPWKSKVHVKTLKTTFNPFHFFFPDKKNYAHFYHFFTGTIFYGYNSDNRNGWANSCLMAENWFPQKVAMWSSKFLFFWKFFTDEICVSRSRALFVFCTGVDRWSRKLFSFFHGWKIFPRKKKKTHWTQMGEYKDMP